MRRECRGSWEHARNGSIPRPKKAVLHWRHPRDGNARLYPFWGLLTEALRTGQPQNEVKTGGPGVFETLYADPVFPWKDYHTSTSALRREISPSRSHSRPPHLRGIAFDLPEVAPAFEDYCMAAGAADRVSFVPGSFFDHDLPKADVVLMGHILHDWDLLTKKMLIRKRSRRSRLAAR